MNEGTWKVAVGSDEVTAEYQPAAAGEEVAVFVCAHGAGGSMSDRGMLATASSELPTIVSSFRNQHGAARLAKAQLKPDQFAEEIRSVFRNLSIADKNAFMAEALQTKDNATVAALVTVPAVISGMPAEQAAGYKEAYLRAVAGESGEPIALELEAVCNTFLSVAESLAMPDSFARADGVPRPAAPPASAYQTPGAPPAVAA